MPITTNFCGDVLWVPSVLIPVGERPLMSFSFHWDGIQSFQNIRRMSKPEHIHVPPCWVHGLNISNTCVTQNFRETKLSFPNPIANLLRTCKFACNGRFLHRLLAGTLRRSYVCTCICVCVFDIYIYTYNYIYSYIHYIYIYNICIYHAAPPQGSCRSPLKRPARSAEPFKGQ